MTYFIVMRLGYRNLSYREAVCGLQVGKGMEKAKGSKALKLALQHWLEAVRHSFLCALYNIVLMLCNFVTLV